MSKTVKILLIVLMAIVISGAIAFTVFYVNVNAVRFDYVNRNVYVDCDIEIPFFGNKLMLEESGGVYSPPLGMGVKNIEVYSAVNSPIYAFAFTMVCQYGESNVHIVDYEVENDGKTLSVKLSGTIENGGETVPIEKLFVFNIENASPDNLPTWTNRTEADNEFYPYE